MGLPSLAELRLLRRTLARKRDLVRRLGDLRLGSGSKIGFPRQLDGARHITIGAGTRIQPSAWLSAYEEYAGQRFTPRIVIGSNVYIGFFACITSIDEVRIEDDCVFSEFVYLSDHSHGFDPRNGPIGQQPLTRKGPVSVGANSFIGYHACVLSGVAIGRNCVVGANAVVTKSVPDFSMVAGTPARVIARFSHDSNRWLRVDNDLDGDQSSDRGR